MILIYRGLAGSQLYGTATEKSDKDYVEVYLPSMEDIFGLGDKWKGIAQKTGEIDVQRFKVNQFFRLLGKGNPNVLETAFLFNVEFIVPDFQAALLNLREILHKDKVVNAHLGFAIQQTNKMLPAKAKWAGPRREKLFDKYGYDVKYASHAIRLVYQCIELLMTGKVIYPYSSWLIKKLKAIRQGEFGLAEVRDEFEDKIAEVEELKKKKCPIDNTNKNTEINRRLIKLYKKVGYAR